MKKTKIICSIGPASNSVDTIEQMINVGMNCARINFSHATYESARETVDNVLEAKKRAKKNIAVLYDTKGPEFRNGEVQEGGINLVEGNTIKVVKETVVGNEERFSVNHPEVIDSLEVGNSILLENGLMKIDVIEKDSDSVTCKIVSGGVLGNKKSLNAPGVHLNVPFISEQDRNDIIFACHNDGDFLAASFVSCKEDIMEIREIIKNEGSNMKIIAKIENTMAIKNIDEIIDEADGVMVARGDLGVEASLEDLPHYQKMIIRKAREHSKFVIVATEMLESMKENSRPTRAEVSDVANAIVDGTDAVMLSGETTLGKFPAETVKYMAEICATAEKYYDKNFNYHYEGQVGSIAKGVVETAKALDAKAIVVDTLTGNSAKNISNLKPSCPIVAVCKDQETANSLTVCYGVKAVVGNHLMDMDEIVEQNTKLAKKALGLEKGDKVVITSGIGSKKKGQITNFMKVEEIK